MTDTTHAAAASTKPAADAIAVTELTKRYGRVAAVDGVSFDIQPGQAVALWGPNGAGKTTILRCLLGLARYEGAIRVHGIDPVRDGRAVRHLIGFVPQELAPSAMTVGEMAAFIARLKGATSEQAHEQLRLLGIEEQTGKALSALSGGMKQRLALALALIGSPAILLLDEPTANLDAAGRADLLELLRRLKHDGMTLLFSSHRPDDVLTLADRILLIERGVIARETRPAQFADELNANARLVVTLSNGHLPEAVRTLTELGYEVAATGRVLTVPIQPNQKAHVLSALARGGVDVHDFEVERGA
jgi:ABC-type multidrug transport system ATPase subunit